ncbi:MAG: acetyl-CoA carboxylase biotin carboxylase subunit [Oscillospiraceae bacterium]|jgi:acetyl-CoA carboxylase biotin carboxylase subunit|nr:acetyl-CoA carboxylase biotin carboxylase subunit [Oscillospiraceae bacterium]
MFSKILIANRGEVAVRVIRACKEMGISTVAVYSKADESALHVALADQSVCIGEAPASDSYLNGSRIVSAALVTRAQAIHPGYGFLSENAGFAELCAENGVEFIGPPAGVIARMGDKDAARQMMRDAGLPVIPGSGVLPDVRAAVDAAAEFGYPVMIKARSGGGGRGIRAVNAPGEMENAFLTASREASEAFGDGAVYVEKMIYPARHVEVQLLADENHNTVCLFERECSIQRNNQKTLEESPSPAVTPELRTRLCDAAAAAARAAGYCNAGTVEFLLDGDGNYYFMEMNVRLQVEHAVTEQVTGIDIVKWQIRIAAGVPLAFTQESVALNGHSIECRINASSAGKVTFLHVPGGPKVRFDSALWSGCAVTPYYDPLLGKVVVHAGTREEAIRKMCAALCELVIEGVPSDIDDRIETLNDPDFKRGEYFCAI